jgi:Ca2+-binding EF-hand superfamily protein
MTSSYWEEMFGVSKSASTQKGDDLATKLFGDLDADGSGGISLKESGLDQETYAAIDTDKDGLVSLAELETALELQRSAMITTMKMAGQEGPPSSEGSGKPDAQELLASIMSNQAPGQSTSGSEESGAATGGAASGQAVYDAMDTNQDGIVSSEELAAALEKQKETIGNGMFAAVGNSGDRMQSVFTSLANSAYNAIAQSINSGTASRNLNVTG